jgi:hypothetical protein
MACDRLVAFARNLGASVTNLLRADEGVVFAYVALALPIIVGFVGLAVDVGGLYFEQRRMQVVADEAAAAGRFGLTSGMSAPLAGKAVAGRNGYTTGVAINCASGCDGRITSTSPRAGDAGAVQAVVTRARPAWLSRLSGRTSYTVVATALVTAAPSGPVCILALGTGAKDANGCTTGSAFNLNGNVTFGSDSCGVAVNSGSAPAADFKGNSINAYGGLDVCGAVSRNNNLTLQQASNLGSQHATSDPYSGATLTWLQGLSTTFPNIASSTKDVNSSTSNPGTYRNLTAGTVTASNGTFSFSGSINSGTTINGSGSANIKVATMSGGTIDAGGTSSVYIDSFNGGTLQNGIFYVNNISGSVTTSNATVVLLKSANFSGGDAPRFSAPFSDATKPNYGIAITSPTADATSGSCKSKLCMTGSSTFALTGALYFPIDASTVNLQGTASNCAQVIASVVNLGGNVKLGRKDCNLKNITGAVPGYPMLVE